MATFAEISSQYGRKRVSVDGLTVEMRSVEELIRLKQEENASADPMFGVSWRPVSLGPAISRRQRTCTDPV